MSFDSIVVTALVVSVIIAIVVCSRLTDDILVVEKAFAVVSWDIGVVKGTAAAVVVSKEVTIDLVVDGLIVVTTYSALNRNQNNMW